MACLRSWKAFFHLPCQASRSCTMLLGVSILAHLNCAVVSMSAVPKALREDADLKTRASTLGSLMVWPSEEGTIDENSVKCNYGILKYVPPAYALWKDVIQIPHCTWVIMAVVDCWEAACSFPFFCLKKMLCLPRRLK